MERSQFTGFHNSFSPLVGSTLSVTEPSVQTSAGYTPSGTILYPNSEHGMLPSGTVGHPGPYTIHGPTETVHTGTSVLDMCRGGNSERLSEFNGNPEHWRTWRFKFEMTVKVRAVKDADKPVLLLSLLSNDLLTETMGQLGSDWEAITYKDLMDYLDKRFNQSKLVMARRHEFLNQCELDSGPLQFLRQLRANHVLCDFDAIKKVADFMIVMTYVKGVKDPRLRYSLLTAAKAEEITTAYISTTEATNKMNGFAPSLPMNALGIHEVGG
ncbi:hypothetical protein NEOKW01_2138, partial [Nematocida sp. AWRm80]